MLNKFRDNKIPLVAFIELTNRCDLDCVHCMRPKSVSGELTKSRLKLLISDLAEIGCLNINFTGGEPLQHKDFFELARHAKSNNFNVKVSSNATGVNRDTITRLKELNPSIVQVSLYGRTAKTHDSITRRQGSHNRTLSAIRLLEKNGIPLQVHMMVMKQNFSELDSFRKLALNKRWKISFDFIIYPGYNGSHEPLKYRITSEQLDEAKRRKFVSPEDFADIGSGEKKFRNIDDLATISCRISSTGDVFPSGTVRKALGSIKESSFRDIWHNSSVARELRDLKFSDYECSACEKSFKCSWDIGLAFAEQGRVTSIPKEWCRFMGKENRDEREYGKM